MILVQRLSRRFVMRLRLLALFLVTLGCFAQTAEITGRLIDASGAVVPNSQITAINSETGIRRETTSNDAGYFNIPNLLPGQYEISIAANGFKPVRRTGIVLRVQQVARLDFS